MTIRHISKARVSTPRTAGLSRAVISRVQAPQKHFQPYVEPGEQIPTRVEGPEYQGAKDGLLKSSRHLRSAQIGTEFTAFLADLKNFFESGAALLQLAGHELADGFARERSDKDAAEQSWRMTGFFGQRLGQAA